jgi:hypothetical protein
MALTIDTLNIYSRLKATGLNEESARGIAEIFGENNGFKRIRHLSFSTLHFLGKENKRLTPELLRLRCFGVDPFEMWPINSYNPNGL